MKGYIHKFDDVTFTFFTESSDISVIVSILDMDSNVLGETYVFPHGIIERDSYGPLIDDIVTKGCVDFEVHHLKHPKVRNATENPLHDPKLWNKPPSVHGSLDSKGNFKFLVGEVTMRVVFLESWKSTFVNVKPKMIKQRSTNDTISFTEEIYRGKVLIKRIRHLYNATMPIRRELHALFNYDNPVWTVFVLFVLEYFDNPARCSKNRRAIQQVTTR